jgi:ribonuclease HI
VALSEPHEVTWNWVRGHAGHPFNERCDRLAKRAADDGIRAADRPKETAEEEKVLPSPVAPARPSPVPVREDSEFDAEEDGQLKLC